MVSTKFRVLLFFLLTGGFLSLLLFNPHELKLLETPQIHAIATECPADYSIDQCINHLQEQAEKIKAESAKINTRISDEEYQQLGLYEKISYFNGIIAKQEAEISLLEIEVEKNRKEIIVLEGEIRVTEDNVNVAAQEINQLQSNIKSRINQTYKNRSINVVEIFINSEDFKTLDKRLFYLNKTREKDNEMLLSMSDQRVEFEKQIAILAQQKQSVELKQVQIEENKTEIVVQQGELAVQRREQQVLLAESERRRVELEAQFSELQAQSNIVSQQVSKLIMERFKQGLIPVQADVKAGDIIGFQSYTGFSYGSHLHFVYMNENKVSISPFSSGLLSLGGPNVNGNLGAAPLGNGAMLTQGYHLPGYAVDMVGRQGTPWWTETYTLTAGQICCYGMCALAGEYYKNGEGTPVRSVKDGKVSAVNVDQCGGKYVVVQHTDGTSSFYLHLQ